MKIIRSVRQMQEYSRALRRKGRTIGFVPTMGYLHEGHVSLVRRAKRENDVCVMSIFVNPTQFGPREDLSRYPRDLKRDTSLAVDAGCDCIFYPSVRALYPDPYLTFIDVKRRGDVLCGSSRPGHFRGVATVVAKLFNIVSPNIAYFGQKDAQQALIIRQMVRDLNMPYAIKVLPIIREPDGLALSSRNVYLDPRQRKDAARIFSSLQTAKKLIESGVRNPTRIKQSLVREIRQIAAIDYVAVVDAKTLEPVATIRGNILIAIAVWVGKTRLIDNLILRVNG